MAVPGYQEFMLPLLQMAADGQEHTIAEAMQRLATELNISEEDQAARLPSGSQTRLYNRACWAIAYLNL